MMKPLEDSRLNKEEREALTKECSKHFFEYAKECIRYDPSKDRFYVWDNGEWKLEAKTTFLYLPLIFNNWLASRHHQLMIWMNRNQEWAGLFQDEFLLIYKWSEQKAIPSAVLHYLKEKVPVKNDQTNS